MGAGCVLRVSGTGFQVDEFLANSSLRPCKVWRVGEQPSKRRPPMNDAGFNLVTSEADDFETQVNETIRFLDVHQSELQRLGKMDGLDGDGLCLDFGVEGKDTDRFPAQYKRFPSALVRRAAMFNIGLEVSLYWFGGRREGD
jgi:hypothetical protein